MSWMDRFFAGGYSRIQIAGSDLPGEVALNFVSGATGLDDPANNRTNVIVAGGGGTTVTAWQPYFPVITDGTTPLDFGDGGIQDAIWRQNGPDSIDILIRFICGAAPNLGTGPFTFPLPAGVAVTLPVGSNMVLFSSVYLRHFGTPTDNRLGAIYVEDSWDHVVLVAAGTNNVVTSSDPITLGAAGDAVYLSGTVPASGF